MNFTISLQIIRLNSHTVIFPGKMLISYESEQEEIHLNLNIPSHIKIIISVKILPCVNCDISFNIILMSQFS